MIKSVLIFVALLFCVTGVIAAAPNATFVSPSPSEGGISLDDVTLNISVTDADGDDTYAFLDDSLDLWVRGDGNVTDSSGNWESTHFAGSYGDGVFNQSLYFPGGNDYLSFSSSAGNFSDNFTLSTWMYSNNDNGALISRRYDSNWHWILLYNGDLAFQDGASQYSATGSVPYNQWNHVGVVIDDGQGTFYVDGEPSGTFTPNITYANNPLSLGVRLISVGTGSGFDFDGYMDETMVFGRPLSPNEMKALYNATASNIERDVNNLSMGDQSYTAKAVDTTGATETETLSWNVSYIGSTVISTFLDKNFTSQDLTVSYESLATFNITDWRVNGTSITTLNMPFDTNSTEYVNDYSTFQNHGVHQGAVFNDSCLIHGCYHFSEGTQLNITNFTGIDNKEYSVTAWVYPTDTVGFTLIFYGADGKELLTRNGKLAYYAGSWKEGSTTLSPGNWYYLVVTRDENGNVKGYVNGDQEISGIRNDNEPVTTATIGYKLDSTLHWIGNIDNMYVYEKVLSGDQIQSIYEDGLAGRAISTIVSEETSVGENWSVNVTGVGDDYVTTSSLLSNSLTILDDPKVTEASLYTEGNTNTTAQNLLLNYSSTNALSSITDWRVNGTSWAALNMPFEINGTVPDYSTSSNDGAVSGATWDDSCRVGGCYSFDGSNDYINGPDSGFTRALDDDATYSWSVWFKGNNLGNTAVILSGTNQDGCGDSETVFETASCGVNEVRVIAADTFVAFNGVSDDVWYHFVGVRDGTNLSLYVDGEYIDSSTISDGSGRDSYQMKIGRPHRDSRYFKGQIDEVLIFDHALSSNQIDQIYQDGLTGQPVTTIVSDETSVGDNWSAEVTAANVITSGSLLSNNLTVLTATTISAEDQVLNHNGSIQSDPTNLTGEAGNSLQLQLVNLTDTVVNSTMNVTFNVTGIYEELFTNISNNTVVNSSFFELPDYQSYPYTITVQNNYTSTTTLTGDLQASNIAPNITSLSTYRNLEANSCMVGQNCKIRVAMIEDACTLPPVYSNAKIRYDSDSNYTLSDTNLEIFYPFNLSDGTDFSQNDNDATLTNITFINAPNDKAAYLDGSTSTLVFPSSITLDKNNDTLSFNLKMDDVSSPWIPIIGSSSVSYKQVISVRPDKVDGKDTIEIETNTNNQGCGGILNSDVGSWSHIALVMSNGTCTWYQDGEVLKPYLQTVVSDNTTIDKIGGAGSRVTFMGGIDEFKLWQDTLTSDEVEEEANRAMDNTLSYQELSVVSDPSDSNLCAFDSGIFVPQQEGQFSVYVNYTDNQSQNTYSSRNFVVVEPSSGGGGGGGGGGDHGADDTSSDTSKNESNIEFIIDPQDPSFKVSPGTVLNQEFTITNVKDAANFTLLIREDNQTENWMLFSATGERAGSVWLEKGRESSQDDTVVVSYVVTIPHGTEPGRYPLVVDINATKIATGETLTDQQIINVEVREGTVQSFMDFLDYTLWEVDDEICLEVGGDCDDPKSVDIDLKVKHVLTTLAGVIIAIMLLWLFRSALSSRR